MQPRYATALLAAPLLLCSGCQNPDTSSPLPPPDGGAEVQPPRNPSRWNTILGRPTDTSIAISVLADAPGDRVVIEYGTQLNDARTALVGGQRGPAAVSAGGEPALVELTGLTGDTLYYYQVHYQPSGQAEVVDSVHSFHTQRKPGRAFRFGVQGDTHPERSTKMFNADLFTRTMQQVRDRQPDLYFMLGDDFSIERTIQIFKDANYGPGYLFTKAVEGALPFAQYQVLRSPLVQAMIVDGVGATPGDAAYLELRQRYLGIAANATALFLVNGNHEQAHSASLGGVFNNAAVWAADGRLKYYPLPAPGGFYGGDEQRLLPVNGYPTIRAADGLLRDYYAFTWGDALFVTIDPYWHADNMPESTLYNGDASKDIWSATMGDEQYAWLKQITWAGSAHPHA